MLINGVRNYAGTDLELLEYESQNPAGVAQYACNYR
jgi:hypothetical protein